jgi:hypothetical protein
MPNDEPNNLDHPATKADLARMRGDFEQLFVTKSQMEQLLADQANVILEAVDEKLDKKLGEKFDPVNTKLDGILKGVEALQQENTAGAAQLRRHDDKLGDHERRIKTLELHPQQSV